MISQQTIMQTAQFLGEATKPARVILFSSYAHGDTGEESGWDFLVVEQPTLSEKFGEMVRLCQVLCPLRIAAECSQAEVNQQQQACSTAVYWALYEGKVLYESRD